MDLEKLKYPVGKFQYDENEDRGNWIDDIIAFPSKLMEALAATTIEQLSWKYRPDGWSIKQVVHHCADSHMNAYVRFKLSLTEENPTIKPYMEHLWAEHDDANSDDLRYSYAILTGLHGRWGHMLLDMNDKDFSKYFVHPEGNVNYSLNKATAMYAWHANHHLAHIEQGLKTEGKY